MYAVGDVVYLGKALAFHPEVVLFVCGPMHISAWSFLVLVF
jgi:hypothetical protein